MKYKFLRKFLRLQDGESAKSGGSANVFDCGVGWYGCLDGMAICKGVRPDIGNVAFVLQVKDSSKEWREKLDKHTSEADYDLIIRKAGAES